MLTGKNFVAKIVADNQALFKASQLNVKAYFDSKPSQQELVDHFVGRMVNERMNMVEIAKTVSELPADTDPVELELLSKQALDEAIHFKLVKEVIEHIKGEKIDVEAAMGDERRQNTAKGAALLAKYGAEDDPIALACYQLVAEGRAEAVWTTMSECIEDEFIAGRYAKIARDEGFHASIGARKLEQLMKSDDDRAHALDLVARMRKDLYEISCLNTTAAEEGKKLVSDAYGW
jgi:rubrerythrin